MARYRWFHADWPFSIRTLAKNLKGMPFDTKHNDGFVIDRVRDEFLESRYIERVELSEKVVDPFGTELTFDRVEFKQCQFRATSGVLSLEILNPPRSTQGLVSHLLQATEFKLAISPLSADVLAWAKEFQTLTKIKCTVNSVQIGALELEPGVVAKTTITGINDVSLVSKAFVKDRKHTLEKIQLRLSGRHEGVISLSHTASAKVDVAEGDELVSALRESLALHSRYQ